MILAPKWQSLKVIQEILIANGKSETEALAIMTPLQTLHKLRTVVKGHASTEKKTTAEVEARTDYGNFRMHFNQLTADCDNALNEVLAVFGFILESKI